MRLPSVFLVIALAAAAVFVSQAGEPPGIATNLPPPAGNVGPRIVFAEPFFDFGRVQSGKVLDHDFIFTNLGDQTLEITDVQSSCGCTAVTNWDRRIESGKPGTLHVLFNTGGMAGSVAKNLWVVSNDTNQPSVVLGIGATVWKLIDAVPTLATFAFGPDSQTNETRIIRLLSNVEEPVTLSAPECTNRSFHAELRVVHPGKEFELQISVIPPLGAGSQTVPVTMKTSLAQMPVLTVNAYAMVQPALTVTPPRILLQMPVEESRQFVVKIRNNGSRAMTLSDPSINADGASVQLRELQAGKMFELTVTFPAGFRGQPGKTVEAQLKSNLPHAPVISVPVTQLKPTES